VTSSDQAVAPRALTVTVLIALVGGGVAAFLTPMPVRAYIVCGVIALFFVAAVVAKDVAPGAKVVIALVLIALAIGFDLLFTHGQAAAGRAVVIVASGTRVPALYLTHVLKRKDPPRWQGRHAGIVVLVIVGASVSAFLFGLFGAIERGLEHGSSGYARQHGTLVKVQLPETCHQKRGSDIVTCEGANWTVNGKTVKGELVGDVDSLGNSLLGHVDTVQAFALDDTAYAERYADVNPPKVSALSRAPVWLMIPILPVVVLAGIWFVRAGIRGVNAGTA
jgi:hypothetical protein